MSKGSRFRKTLDKKKFDENWDKIFRKKEKPSEPKQDNE